MPELPEVETIVNQLLKKVKGKIISEIEVMDYNKRFQGKRKLVLSKIIEVERRAKQIIFDLFNHYSFIIHLKMSGQLVYHQKKPSELKKATQNGFCLISGCFLAYFWDPFHAERAQESYIFGEGLWDRSKDCFWTIFGSIFSP